jgi:hypothetical protein
MEIFSNKYYKFYLIITSLILIILIFQWINYLTENNFIVECFTQDHTSEKYSHTVDLPLTTTYSCSNFCGPTSRCSITGQQCSADIDCPGCQPIISSSSKSNTTCVEGNNDAGKLTGGVTPNYSSLTNGYGTQETVITSNMFSKPLLPNFGINTWKGTFNQGVNLFNKRYKPSKSQQTINYPERYSLTGEFIDDGPFASNAPIN